MHGGKTRKVGDICLLPIFLFLLWTPAKHFSLREKNIQLQILLHPYMLHFTSGSVSSFPFLIAKTNPFLYKSWNKMHGSHGLSKKKWKAKWHPTESSLEGISKRATFPHRCSYSSWILHHPLFRLFQCCFFKLKNVPTVFSSYAPAQKKAVFLFHIKMDIMRTWVSACAYKCTHVYIWRQPS